MIVLDTNVVSELLRPAPAPSVEAWLAAQDGATVYFTTVGEAELHFGVAILPMGRRRTALAQAIKGILEEDFRGPILPPILPFDDAVAQAYATIPEILNNWSSARSPRVGVGCALRSKAGSREKIQPV